MVISLLAARTVVKFFLSCDLMPVSQSNQPQSEMQSGKNSQVLLRCRLFFNREKLTLKQTGASKPAVEACWSLCEVSARPSRVFETSHTFIVEVSQPLVTFLCRSFQSWSRLISMTVFATSWTTLFLPSTSCINSSSTPV